MKMTVLRKMEYKGYRIYVMYFDFVFQYLITDKNLNLYQDHITLKPRLLNLLKFKLNLLKEPYSREEMEAGEDIVLNGATKSVDALIDGLEANKREAKQIKEVYKKKGNKECFWRTIPSDSGEMIYECLTHTGSFAPIIDGEKPYHAPVEEGILSPIQMENI